ncbi:MAG: T9SS type A sorting domain-containing protein [Bacteroidales bacterium]|nr:T9SS type A sorting domain-containing protein [Bacteroidales bacterium]
MKKLTALFILLPVGLMAQDWMPINPSNVYFYKTNGSELINNTVKIDSVGYYENDPVLFLNTIAAECDTCDGNSIPCSNWGNSPYRYLIVVPNFLQKQLHIMDDGKWYFQDTAGFVLLPRANLSDSWLFDTANNVLATITEKSFTEVFGQVFDSVKTISLSNGKVIRLSKNYGILEFPDLRGDAEPAFLSGIEGTTNAGTQIYHFRDYFDFNIGDIFQYWFDQYQVIDQVYYTTRYTKYQIVSKEISADTIRYGIEGIIQENTDNGFRFSDTLVFIDSAKHITNRYINTLADYESESFLEGMYLVRLLYSNNSFTLIDTSSLVDFSNPEAFEPNLFWYCEESPGFLGAQDMENIKHTYTPGLGLTKFEIEGFEWGTIDWLIGFIRDGDTVGTIYEDGVLLTVQEPIEPKLFKTIVYPNPFHSSTNITCELHQPSSIQITFYNHLGKQIDYIRKEQAQGKQQFVWHAERFPAGVYYFRLQTGKQTASGKMLLIR